MRVSRTALSVSFALALSLPLLNDSASAASVGSSTEDGHLVVSVWSADFDGTEAVDASSGTVTGVVTTGMEGVYSPNHQQIAYQADNGPCVVQPEGGCAWQPDLMISSASGADSRILVHAIQTESGDAYVENPTWSPDGRQVYFDSDWGVGRINTDGTGFATVAPGFAPAVSPDGNRLAFLKTVSYQAADGTTQYGIDLFLVDLATGSISQVTTDHQVQTTPPRWSPDGASIVYATQSGVDVLNVATGAVSDIYDAGSAPTQILYIKTPVYSPDGSQIAFAGYDPISGTSGLYAMGADGSSLHPVAAIPGSLTEWIE